MNNSQTKSLIRGAVYGALVGDALGVPVEFSERIRRDADPVCNMRAFGTWNQPAGTWSDDGALVLCSLEALADSQLKSDFDANILGNLFVDWMKNGHWTAHGKVFDIGGATHASLCRIATGADAATAGGKTVNDNGNGSLMRILPVALRFGLEVSPQEIAGLAMRASAITHAHIRSQLACACYCLIAQKFLQTPNTEKTPARIHAYSLNIIQAAIEEFQPVIDSYPSEKEHFARIMEGGLDIAGRSTISSGGYVIDTLEASIWCLLNYESFTEIVLAAVNLGGDTDTTGCVAGGLAGLRHGDEDIPQEWLTALPRHDELSQLLDRFILKTLNIE